MPIPVWLDCDPGHDDALAIVLAGHSERLNLLGVSTVAGNQTLELVTENALRVLHAAGLGAVPVVAGQARPLMRPSVSCAPVRGVIFFFYTAAGFPMETSHFCQDPLFSFFSSLSSSSSKPMISGKKKPFTREEE
jgi:inosine-uridine nucleoside N-ribohydrolase